MKWQFFYTAGKTYISTANISKIEQHTQKLQERGKIWIFDFRVIWTLTAK